MPESKPRTITIDNIDGVDHCDVCGGDVLSGIVTMFKAEGTASWLVVDTTCHNCADAIMQRTAEAVSAVQAAYSQAAASRLN